MRESRREIRNACGQAALYALGWLPTEESSIYERHLEICPACSGEVKSLREATVGLAPEVEPPAGLRERVMARVRQERRISSAAASSRIGGGRAEPPPAVPAGVTLLRSAARGEWSPTGVDGVEVRRLFVDEPNDRATMLVRMAPGASYPRHIHGGTEECYVLEGDLWLGGVQMRAGDYQRAEAGSQHGVQSTREGNLLLVICSLHDEVIPGSPLPA